MKPEDIARELERLSRLTFDGWNESDVRENFIARLLDLLGYVRNSDYDINREDHHLLLSPYRRVGRKSIRIDYRLVVRKQSFWIIEAKPPTPDISVEDVHQAFLYAEHPEVRARYFVVCNGLRTDVYDVRNPDDLVLSVPTRDLPRRFSELNQLIGAQAILDHLHDRLAADLRAVLSAEILEDRARRLQARLNSVFTETASLIQQNRVNVFRAKMADGETEWRQLVESANGSLQIATDVMHAPLSLNMFGVAENALKHWFEREDDAAREQTVKALIGQLTQLMPTHRRFNLLRMLIRLRHAPLVEKSKPTIDAAIVSNIKSALSGFDDTLPTKLAWQLEGAIFRVLYKASFCDTALTKELENIVQQKLSLLTAEDRVLGDPTVDGERLAAAHNLAANAFLHLVRQPLQTIQGACAGLLVSESTLDANFASATQDRRQSLHIYASYDRPFDFMRSQLFHVLAFEFEQIVDLVDDAVMRRTADLLARMTADETYAVNYAEEFLTRVLWQRDAVHWECERPTEVFPPLLRGVFVHRTTRPPVVTVRIWGPVAGGYAELLADLDLSALRLTVKSAREMD